MNILIATPRTMISLQDSSRQKNVQKGSKRGRGGGGRCCEYYHIERGDSRKCPSRTHHVSSHVCTVRGGIATEADSNLGVATYSCSYRRISLPTTKKRPHSQSSQELGMLFHRKRAEPGRGSPMFGRGRTYERRSIWSVHRVPHVVCTRRLSGQQLSTPRDPGGPYRSGTTGTS